MTVQHQASRPSSRFGGWVGFWLWALVGAGVVLVQRRGEWKDGSVLLGLISGAGLPLLLVAALNWSSWQDRTIGDGTPNPYDWGAVGVLLIGAGTAAYALRRRRRP